MNNKNVSTYISQEELEHLVFSAYCLGTISIGKVADLLGIVPTEAESFFQSWLAQQPSDIQAYYQESTDKAWADYFDGLFGVKIESN